MRQFFIALCAIFPLLAFADIIATFNNGNIEDVTVVSIGADEVVYNQGGTQKTIASSEVEGVLYDDGRFVTPPKKAAVTESLDTAKDDDSWAVEDAPSDEVQTKSTNRHQKHEKTERNGNNSNVKQAFKEAGVAIKGAFTTMFDAMRKKKDEGLSESDTETKAKKSKRTEREANQPHPAASEDGW